MRNINERIQEVYRKSAVIKTKRRKKINTAILLALPLCLCAVISTALLLPKITEYDYNDNEAVSDSAGAIASATVEVSDLSGEFYQKVAKDRNAYQVHDYIKSVLEPTKDVNKGSSAKPQDSDLASDVYKITVTIDGDTQYEYIYDFKTLKFQGQSVAVTEQQEKVLNGMLGIANPNGEQVRFATCGNTETTIYLEDGRKYSFIGGDSVYLTNLLISLEYSEQKVSDDTAHYRVDTEFQTGYLLSKTYARLGNAQADFDEQERKMVAEILEKADKEAI